MKKSFSIFILFTLFRIALAAITNTNFIATTHAQVVSAETDTIIDLSLEDEEVEGEMDALSDSLVAFPSSGLYFNWDTAHIHVPKFDISTLKDDEKELLLFSEGSCGYYHPFNGKVTSGFGPRRKRYHYGIDIDLETGDGVSAAFDGKVRIAKLSKSYGNVIVIRHANGLETYYAHLSKISVEVGKDVLAGDIIGLGGNTGRSRGSHLHFEVRYLGQPIDPSEIISFDNQQLLSDTYCLSKKTFDYVSAAKKAAAKNIASSKNKKGTKVHVVKKGDTLSAIARRYGTTTKVLCKKNGIKATSVLRLGQKIKI